jgi:hypothetical protein
VKHLTALVKEEARKNLSLIAIGSKLSVIFSLPPLFVPSGVFFNVVFL